jgi:hypothetical protein
VCGALERVRDACSGMHQEAKQLPDELSPDLRRWMLCGVAASAVVAVFLRIMQMYLGVLVPLVRL